MASSNEQCSVLVPSMDRMWSPVCRAPLLTEWESEQGEADSVRQSSGQPLSLPICPSLWQSPSCLSPVHHAGRLDALDGNDWLVPVGAGGE